MLQGTPFDLEIKLLSVWSFVFSLQVCTGEYCIPPLGGFAALICPKVNPGSIPTCSWERLQIHSDPDRDLLKGLTEDE